MEKVIADTGFAVALIHRFDGQHAEVVPIYARYPKILLPRLALVEVVYLIGRDASLPLVISFLKGLSVSRFELIDAKDEDVERAASIISQYADSKTDFVDAMIMAIAERLNITTVLTVDQRDFSLFRPSHCTSFTILP